ncbi:MAG: hypothetical protein OXI60_00675 [Acidiferrobacterales bacterium]|nr:hypothetical protein [Acidiferrobacterales bacterium]
MTDVRIHILPILALGLLLGLESTRADSSDHIGPDPIQSENCLVITPERSIVCRGRYSKPSSVGTPTLTINCNPGLFLIITHNQIAGRTSVSRVTLDAPEGRFTQQWLAPSEFQSAGLFFYRGSGDTEYESIVRFVGSMMLPETTEVGFSIDDGVTSGTFTLTASDRYLLKQIAPSCN